MGKRITQQARGKGSLTFRVRPRAYKHRITYPKLNASGDAKIIKIFNSAGHSSPLAKIKINDEFFISPCANGIFEGQTIKINDKREGDVIENQDIMQLKNLSIGTKIFNIEPSPGIGGKLVRAGGTSATIKTISPKKIEIIINKRKLELNPDCRATVGVIAGDQRKSKPLVKAGKRHHIMLSQGRKWHRTSPVKVNAVDHPFGGGRGKRIKSKISKRNAPPGKKVGHLRPRRTGKKR